MIDHSTPERDETIEKLIEAVKAKNDGTHMDFHVPFPQEKNLIGYMGIRSDLLYCKDALIKLKEVENSDRDSIIMAALWYSIIAIYGKCFTDATTSSSPKLQKESCFESGDQELIRTHDHLLDLRHNFISHRGQSNQDVTIVYLQIMLDKISTKISFQQMKRQYDLSLAKEYEELFDHLIVRVEEKFLKPGNSAWTTIMKSMSFAELQTFQIAGPKLPLKDKN